MNREFTVKARKRLLTIPCNKRKIEGLHTSNNANPTPIDGEFIWGRDDILISRTPGTFKDYPDD